MITSRKEETEVQQTVASCGTQFQSCKLLIHTELGKLVVEQKLKQHALLTVSQDWENLAIAMLSTRKPPPTLNKKP